ncbi:MAG: DoxX family protein [Bacteroidales bacterium]
MLRILYVLLSVLLGSVFIFSAITKLFPVELFEISLVEGYVSNWGMAPFLARFIIGVEFVLGVFLIANKYLNTKIIHLGIVLVIAFTIHLIILYFLQGNNQNCMCFGTFVSMTPLQSIVKNGVLLFGLFVLLYKHESLAYSVPVYIYIIAIFFLLLTPFALRPFFISTVQRTSDFSGKPLNLNKIDTDYALDTGKHIVGFMTLSCPHCEIAAYKMHVIKQQNPDIPMFLFLNGDSLLLEQFFESTYATNIPYKLIDNPNFMYRIESKVPAIYFINNDTVVKKSAYTEMSEQSINQWFDE